MEMKSLWWTPQEFLRQRSRNLSKNSACKYTNRISESSQWYFSVVLLQFKSVYGNAKLICGDVFNPFKFFSTQSVVFLEISVIVNLRGWSKFLPSHNWSRSRNWSVRNMKIYLEVVCNWDRVREMSKNRGSTEQKFTVTKIDLCS